MCFSCRRLAMRLRNETLRHFRTGIFHEVLITVGIPTTLFYKVLYTYCSSDVGERV